VNSLKTSLIVPLLCGSILVLAASTNLFAGDNSPTPTPSSNARATHGETKNEVDRKANSKYIGETEKNLRGTAVSPTPTPSSDRIKWDGKYVAGRTSASPTAPPRASPASQKKVHDNIVSSPVGPALKNASPTPTPKAK
jgi:hypothetical protein